MKIDDLHMVEVDRLQSNCGLIYYGKNGYRVAGLTIHFTKGTYSHISFHDVNGYFKFAHKNSEVRRLAQIWFTSKRPKESQKMAKALAAENQKKQEQREALRAEKEAKRDAYFLKIEKAFLHVTNAA